MTWHRLSDRLSLGHGMRHSVGRSYNCKIGGRIEVEYQISKIVELLAAWSAMRLLFSGEKGLPLLTALGLSFPWTPLESRGLQGRLLVLVLFSCFQNPVC